MKVPENVTRRKTCKLCEFTFWGKDVEHAFRKLPSYSSANPKYKSPCKFCEIENRTIKTRQNRWKTKVGRTRRTHRESLGISVERLESSFGWDIDLMAHEGAHAYSNGCSECHDPYEIMGSGLKDITLDIWDPRIEPFYGSNTRWICFSCNSTKGDMIPEDWAIYKRLHRERAAHLAEHAMIIQPEQLVFASWRLDA